MVDVSIVNETSPEANWNRQADSRMADGRTDKSVYWEAAPPKMTAIAILQFSPMPAYFCCG